MPVFVLRISVIESPYLTAAFGIMKTGLIGNPGDCLMEITDYAGVASHAKIMDF